MFEHEPDGSVGVLALHADRRRKTAFVIGWIRPSLDGSFLASPTFEEMQQYEEWGSHPTAEDALERLMDWKIQETQNDLDARGLKDFEDEEAGKILSLQAAMAAVHETSGKTKRALAASAASAVTEAVANMLLVSSYEDVMAAVSRAIVSGVIES